MRFKRLENAEKALALATNDGDAQAIAYAKEAVENASKEVLTSLENNYESLSEIEQFLATQSQTASAPVQAALVSRYSNTALSEMSANVNMALQIRT